MATYADFSRTATERRYATIGDREFDVTSAPIGVVLFLNKRTAERKRDGLGVLYVDYLEALALWLKAEDPEITTKWIETTLNGDQFQQVILALFSDLNKVPLVQFEEKAPSLPKNWKDEE